ncbi:MAG: ATP-binding cassette domain-containing protein [Acidimicrobiales bacterium]
MLVANDHVDFDVMAGEVHAAGRERRRQVDVDEGALRRERAPGGDGHRVGHAARAGSTAASRAAGIGMVFQDLRLIPAFTVLENIDLALDSAGSRKERRAKLLEAGERWGLPVDPDRCATSSLAERQRVEILRVLLLDAKVVILDEPTSALAPQEVDALLAVVDQLRATGSAS